MGGTLRGEEDVKGRDQQEKPQGVEETNDEEGDKADREDGQPLCVCVCVCVCVSGGGGEREEKTVVRESDTQVKWCAAGVQERGGRKVSGIRNDGGWDDGSSCVSDTQSPKVSQPTRRVFPMPKKEMRCPHFLCHFLQLLRSSRRGMTRAAIASSTSPSTP